MLKNFVENSVILYEKSFVSYNVHGLIHLAEDVKRYGPLHHFSSFPFESFLYSIKKKVRKSEKPLKQLVQRISEIEQNTIGDRIDHNSKLVLKKEHFRGPIVGDHFKT